MPPKIAIIGAGIAGLSAGCYARMNSYDVDIYESHNLPAFFAPSVDLIIARDGFWHATPHYAARSG